MPGFLPESCDTRGLQNPKNRSRPNEQIMATATRVFRRGAISAKSLLIRTRAPRPNGRDPLVDDAATKQRFCGAYTREEWRKVSNVSTNDEQLQNVFCLGIDGGVTVTALRAPNNRVTSRGVKHSVNASDTSALRQKARIS